MDASKDISDAALQPEGRQPNSAESHWLFYDGLCPFCRTSVRLLSRLDWLRRLRPMDLHVQAAEAAQRVPGLTHQQMMAAMQLITPGRRVYGGYFAFRRLARAIPPLWPLVPFLYLPGMARLGPAIYGWIARRRYGLARCSSGNTCKL